MPELEISSFNLAFFQKAKKPVGDDQFSEIYSTVLKYFPLVDQLSNPILTARRKQGGQISLNPVFLQFLGMDTKDFDSDINITKDISSVYFGQYKTEKINQIAIRLASTIQARMTNSERQLIINESFKLSSETARELDYEGEIKIGVRLVFQRGGKRYDLKIEPYFTDPDFNYIDLNIVIPNLEKPPDISYDLLYEEVRFLKENISKLIP
jgi:hypothetical protein